MAEAKHHCVRPAIVAKRTMNSAGGKASHALPVRNPTPLVIYMIPPIAQPNLRGAPCCGTGVVFSRYRNVAL